MTFESAIDRAVAALRDAARLSGASPVIDELEHFAERVAALPAEEAGWDEYMAECCRRCSCAEVWRPCGGVQAGGPCDGLEDRECADSDYPTEECTDEPF